MSGLEIVAGPRSTDVRRLLDGAGLPSADVDEALLCKRLKTARRVCINGVTVGK